MIAPKSLIVLLLLGAALAAQEPEEDATQRIDRLEGRLRALERRVVLLLDQVRELELNARTTEREQKPASESEEIERLKQRLARLEAAFLDQGLSERPRTSAPAAADGLTTWPEMPYGESLEFAVLKVRRLPQELPEGGRWFRIEVELARIDDTLKALTKETALDGERYLTATTALPQELTRYRLSLERLGAQASTAWLKELAPREEGAAGQHRCVKFIRVKKLQSHRDGYDGRSGTVRAWRGDLYWHENDVFFLENGDLHLLGEGAARHHIRFLRPNPAPAVTNDG